jgi:hypothetical protein
VSDRISITVDPGFESLVDSMRENGQQVPILVRPQSASPGRYQVAYGRRRLRAAALLGRMVRAIVQTLTDNELVTVHFRALVTIPRTPTAIEVTTALSEMEMLREEIINQLEMQIKTGNYKRQSLPK